MTGQSGGFDACPLSCYTSNRWVHSRFWGESVFQQSSPTSATQRRQGQQTCFGWHGCRPGPIRPTQGLTGANVGEIVWDSMTEGKWILLCQRHIKIQLAQRLWPGSPRFLLSALRPSGRKKWVRASAQNCARRIAGRDACPTLGWEEYLSCYGTM